jgi:hypothetical protein
MGKTFYNLYDEICNPLNLWWAYKDAARGKRYTPAVASFYELLIEATRSTKRKRQLLIQADVELEKLRLYVRMSQQRNLTSISQYHFAAGVLVEIGKLLGAG